MEPAVMFFGFLQVLILTSAPVLLIIWLLWLGWTSFKKHDCDKDFSRDTYGALSIGSLLLAILVCIAGMYVRAYVFGIDL